MVNANALGFLPGNDAGLNAEALQAAVDLGGEIFVEAAGVYDLSETVRIGDNTALVFADGVDAEHLIAVIYAPRSGSAALRDKAASNGKKLEACATGRIVPVLEYGKEFTRIRYEGQEGWVMTDALVFFRGGESPLGTGVLHMKGKTDGKDSVNVRTSASSSSAMRLAEARQPLSSSCTS